MRFELAVPVFEQYKTIHALDHVASQWLRDNEQTMYIKTFHFLTFLYGVLSQSFVKFNGTFSTVQY